MARPDDGRGTGGTTAVAVTTHKLSEAEVLALRDEAAEQMLLAAGDRLRWYDPEKCSDSPEEACDEATERMMAAAEVYGACRNVELKFSTAKGLPSPVEAADVEFTDRALKFLERTRDETRGMLEYQRGSIEVSENTASETFLLFVLDGIQAAQEGGES